MNNPASDAGPAPAWVNASMRFTGFVDAKALRKLDQVLSPRALAVLIRDTHAAKKELLPWLKLATFGDKRSEKNSLRHDDNLLELTGVEADYDGALGHLGKPFDLAAARDALKGRNVRAILYTSPSHIRVTGSNPQGGPRWRVLALFSAPVERIEHSAMIGRLAGIFAEKGCTFSRESFTLSQAYYYGYVDGATQHRVLLLDGDPLDQRQDLDEIAVGKPSLAEKPRPDGETGDGLDELLAAIVSGANYHEATTRLAGAWAAQRKPLGDALLLIQSAFRMVPEAQRDARWQARYDDVGRCVRGVYHKHLHPTPNAPPLRLREPAGVLDTRRYALKAVQHAQVRLTEALAEESEALLRVEARALARFVQNDLLTLREARDGLLDIAVARGLSVELVFSILSLALERSIR